MRAASQSAVETHLIMLGDELGTSHPEESALDSAVYRRQDSGRGGFLSPTKEHAAR